MSHPHLSTSAPSSTRPATTSGGHLVKFYEDDQHLIAVLDEFLNDTWAEGRAAVVVATQPHLAALERRWTYRGLDTASLRASSRLITANADELLSQFMQGDVPGPAAFRAMAEPLIVEAASNSTGVSVFGEMVDLLASRGQFEAAVRLEELWTHLGTLHPFTLLCAYHIDRFAAHPNSPYFAAVCAAHSHHLPTETYTSLTTEQERLAEIARLQQKARSLEHEMLQRQQSDDIAREEARSLAALNRIGSTIVAELDLERVVQTVTDAATDVCGAAFGAFFYNVQTAEDGAYWLYTLSGADRKSFAHFPMPRATHVFGPTFRGEGIIRSDDITKDARYGQWAPHHGMPEGHLPVRSYLAAPVVSRSGEVTGGLFFGHPEPEKFTERAERLLAGIAAQAAIAIDNARLYQAAQKELAERERAEAALRDADRRKDEFLAMLGHELRNPLAPIRNVTELLRRRGDADPAVNQLIGILDRQVQQMSRLLDDLLDVGRITQGKIQMQQDELLLDDVIAHAIETSTPQLRQCGHILHTEITTEPMTVRGDLMRLVQMLSNILNNAARYTPDGGVITLTSVRDGSNALVRVQDTGVGIADDVLPRIFDLFAQGSQALERSQGGLGIGLTLVKRIAELHGGSVEARSEGTGKGSTFEIRLPLVADNVSRGVPNTQFDGTSTRKRVLVVDDNRDALESIEIVLRMSGHDICTAADGHTALQLVDRMPFDVVVLDIGLPGMNGYEVAETLRSRGVSSYLIALTAYAQPEDRARAFEAGFDAHLAKPADPVMLERLIAQRAALASPGGLTPV